MTDVDVPAMIDAYLREHALELSEQERAVAQAALEGAASAVVPIVRALVDERERLRGLVTLAREALIEERGASTVEGCACKACEFMRATKPATQEAA